MVTDDCSKPLGLEDYSIKNSQISGGTSYNDDYANYGSQNARLHASSGYRADPSTVAPLNMIGIELGEDTVITGIATQGYGDPTVSEWVTNFNVFYKNSLGRYQPVRSIDGKALVRLSKIGKIEPVNRYSLFHCSVHQRIQSASFPLTVIRGSYVPVPQSAVVYVVAMR